MAIHLLRDLEHLKRSVLELGAMVEDAIDKAITALVDRRAEVALEVMRGDDEIDRKEVEVEEECLKILALHQPVAADLRFLIAVLKAEARMARERRAAGLGHGHGHGLEPGLRASGPVRRRDTMHAEGTEQNWVVLVGCPT